MDQDILHLLEHSGIITASSEVRRIFLLAFKVAKTDATILITGESGTGKEILARWIHQQSNRVRKPYIAINCGAIAESILESELFGHEKGSFTGATGLRKGHFESADGGTLFLDEVGEMPLETQVKLLRVLESGEYQRVGSSQTLKGDVRIIAATNRSLEAEILQKKFRSDLYYRLKTVELRLPPLRERREDILPLAEKFIIDFELKHGLKFPGFTNEGTESLLSYTYPGNVRELRNILESLLIVENKGKITSEVLSKYFQNSLRALESKSESISNGSKLLAAHSTTSLSKREELVPQSLYWESLQNFHSQDAGNQQELILRALLQLQTDMSEVKSALTALLSEKHTFSSKYNSDSQNDAITKMISPPLQIQPPNLELSEPNEIGKIVNEKDSLKKSLLHTVLQEFATKARVEGKTPTLEELERYAILETLKKNLGNKRKTAEALGITERTLYRKLNSYKIQTDT
ncbi:MAG: sigma 54-interacting transcriptional regulator [Chloroherpetonaceae bacterium]|nr:sigma 54-interacting transcriptional regulator [Chloroherpetonaceae bacterium]